MKNGAFLQRSYTPISSDEDLGTFQLLIKVPSPIECSSVSFDFFLAVKTYEKGNISKYMNELPIGASVEMSGPKGTFKYLPNTYEKIGMIAGGSGITPMFQVITTIRKYFQSLNPFSS